MLDEKDRGVKDFLIIFLFFIFSFGGFCEDEEQIWRVWEMSGIGEYNVKFPKNH